MSDDTPAPSTATRPDADPEITAMLRNVNRVLRSPALVLWTVLGTVAVAASYGLLQPRAYTVTSAFVPQARRAPNALGGLAAQFGLTLPTSEVGQNPSFFQDLATSSEVLRQVVDSSYALGGQAPQRLDDILEAKGDSPELRRDDAVRRLGRVVSASVVAKTGLVKVSVRARDPVLAARVNATILALLDRFNLESRRTQAGAERRFTERRLGEVRDELREAEDRLQAFLQRNREYRNSPELSFQQDRLARDVAMRQQLYTTIAQAYEQAKVEEIRDTPVLSIVEPPRPPARPDPRGLLSLLLVAVAVGLALGVGLALLRAALAEAASPGIPDERQEFHRLRGVILVEIRRPWRLLAPGRR